jgi:hypothetical protein
MWMMNITLVALRPWSPAPHRTEEIFQKKQSIVVRVTVSRINKVKENNASISLAMCFSASAGIDNPTVNGLLIVVGVFTMFFDHFFLILFLHGEANCERDNTDKSENVTKVCQ